MIAFTVFCFAGVIALFAQADLSIGHSENAHLDPSSGTPELIQRRIAEDMLGGRQVLGKDGKPGKSRLMRCGRSEND